MDQNCCWVMLRGDGKHGATTSYFVSILQQWGRNLTSQDCSAAITQTYGVHTAPLESLSNASRITHVRSSRMFSCFNSHVQSSNKSFISLLCPLCDRAPGIYAGQKPCLRLPKGRTLSSSGTAAEWTAIPDIVKSYFVNSLKIWNLIWGNSSLTNYQPTDET
jgi:hypothetical protein